MNFKTQQNFCKIKQLNETLYHNQKKRIKKKYILMYLFIYFCFSVLFKYR